MLTHRMGHPCKLDTGNVPTRRIYPINVPNGLARIGKFIAQESATVGLGEDSAEAPRVLWEGLHAGFRALVDLDTQSINGTAIAHSKISTIKTSPGFAPGTSMGPER